MKNFQQQQQRWTQQQRRNMAGKAWLDQKRKEQERKGQAVPQNASSPYGERTRHSKGVIARSFSFLGTWIVGLIGSAILYSIGGSVAATFLPGDLPYVAAIVLGLIGLIYTYWTAKKKWNE